MTQSQYTSFSRLSTSMSEPHPKDINRQFVRIVVWNFFFTPQQDVGSGYFNLETNCGGTILMYHQVSRNHCSKELSDNDLDQIQIASSLPKLITKEITQPVTWTLEYKLPFSILAKYTEVITPARGVEWKANFYKCADRSSHPHWLTWSIVDLPKPDFHRPEFFGTLIFC